MTPPRRPGRISHRDQLLRNQSTMDMYASLYGKPRVTIDIPPAPKKRAPSQPSGVPLEHDVQFDIIVELRRHPMVGLVERVNSGAAVERNSDGTERHIRFHHVYKVPGVASPMRPSDIHCTLIGGHWAGKRFVVEVKRSNWRGPKNSREEEQIAYIDRVKACGGYGGVFRSWQEVMDELERIARCETTADRSGSTGACAAGAGGRSKG